MAKITKPIKKNQLLNEISDEQKDTINKMLELQDIIINNPPNDKRFKDIDYFMEYYDIISKVQDPNVNYSDEYIVIAINSLYNKVFKHRRY